MADYKHYIIYLRNSKEGFPELNGLHLQYKDSKPHERIYIAKSYDDLGEAISEDLDNPDQPFVLDSITPPCTNNAPDEEIKGTIWQSPSGYRVIERALDGAEMDSVYDAIEKYLEMRKRREKSLPLNKQSL